MQDPPSMLLAHWLRTDLKNGGVYLSGINIADPNATIDFFGGQTQSQGPHAGLGCSISCTAQGPGSFARDGANVDDNTIPLLQHPGQYGVNAIKGAIQVGLQQQSPVFRRQLAHGTLSQIQ